MTVALLVVGPMVIPESRDPDPAPFDVPSSALSMAAVLPLVYGMKTVAERGWAFVVVPPVLVGLVAGWAFIRRQRRLPVPMIDMSPVRGAEVPGGHHRQPPDLLRLRRLDVLPDPVPPAGRRDSPPPGPPSMLLPGAAAGVLSTMTAPAMTRRVGTFTVITTGLAVGAVGFLVLTGLTVDSSLLQVIAALVIIEAGLCAAITVSIDGIMTVVPPEKAGAGASVSETANELGVALGTAVLGSILVAVYRGQLADAPAAAQETLGGAHDVAADLGGAAGDALIAAANAAFTDGVRLASLVTAVLLAGVSLAAGGCRAAERHRHRRQGGGVGSGRAPSAATEPSSRANRWQGRGRGVGLTVVGGTRALGSHPAWPNRAASRGLLVLAPETCGARHAGDSGCQNARAVTGGGISCPRRPAARPPPPWSRRCRSPGPTIAAARTSFGGYATARSAPCSCSPSS